MCRHVFLPFWCEQNIPSAESLLLVLDPHAKFALQDVEDLIFGAMKM
jgi:hypothetical protein